MTRWLSLLKNAWLIVWNLALLALVVGVPLIALYQAGWFAFWLMVAAAGFCWVVRRPVILVGLWLGGRR